MALKETVASQAQRIQLLEELVHALKHRQFGASSEKASPQQNLFNEAEPYVKTATKPKQPIEKNIASPGLLAHIAVSKYADALPLYRQTVMFKRIGVELSRSNLANWMVRGGDLLQPLINRLHEVLTEQTVLHMDETPVQVLKEPGKTAQSKSDMWVMRNTRSTAQGDDVADELAPSGVLYHYAASRSQQTPNDLLADYHGALMVDGYAGYQPACEQHRITRLGCWAHARRKFVEAQAVARQKAGSKTGRAGKADKAMADIQKLYRVELQAKTLTDDERYRLRQEKAKPLIDKLKTWADKSVDQVPPKSAIGKALHYLHNQWPYLVRYLENGAYPIDNNPAENAIRPFVVERKNWLFANSQAGARASANLYSVIETTKANDLEPCAYLKDIFAEPPNATTLEDIDALLPWNSKGGVG